MRRRLGIFMALLLLATPAIAEGATAEGDWELISAVIGGDTYENLAELGMHMTMRLEADGTGVQNVNEDEYPVTWSEADGTIMIDDGNGALPYALQPDGTLQGVDDSGDSMTFARAAASDSAAGAWTLTAVETEETTISDVSTLDYEFDLLLNADGTGRLTVDGDDVSCTWTQNGSAVTLAEDSDDTDDTVSLTLQPDGTFTWAIDDVTLILSRTDYDEDTSESTGIVARILGGLENAIDESEAPENPEDTTETPESPVDTSETVEGIAGTLGTVGGIVNAPGSAGGSADTPGSAGNVTDTPVPAGGSVDTPEPAEGAVIVSEFGYSVRLPEGWSALDSEMVAQLVETIGEDLAAANGFDQSLLDQLAAANMSLYYSPGMSANFNVVREAANYLTMDNFASLEPYYQELYESQGITDFELDGPVDLYGKSCYVASSTTQAGQEQKQYFFLTDDYIFTVTLTNVSEDDAEQILESFEIL